MQIQNSSSFYANSLKQEENVLNDLLERCETLTTQQGALSGSLTEGLQEDFQEVLGTIWNWMAPSAAAPTPISHKKVETVIIDPDRLESFATHRNKLNELIDRLDRQPEDRELQQQCAQIYKDVIACKLNIVAEACLKMQTYIANAELSGREAAQLRVLANELQENMKKAEAEACDVQQQIEEHQKARNEQIQATRKALQEKYLSVGPTINIKTQCEVAVDLGSTFKDFSIFPSYRQQLVEQQEELEEALSEYQKLCEQLRDVIESVDQKPEEMEYKCKILKERCLQQELQFARAFGQFIGDLQLRLEEEALTVTPGVESGTLSVFALRLRQIANDNAQAVKSLNNALGEFGRHEVMETWSMTAWGSLLVQGGGRFKGVIDALKKTRRALASTENDKERMQNSRMLYHAFLQRIIDVIGEKQQILKQPTISSQGKMLLELELSLLNAQFDNLLEKYEKIPVPEKSFLEAVTQKTRETLTMLLSAGYYKPLSSASELRYQKHYADLGYDMITHVSTWLNALKLKEGEGLADCLKREVVSFMKWADKHPHRAAALASDIAQTCAIIGDQTYTDQFISTMRTKACAAAFLEGWGGFMEEEPEAREELRYRALADLCRYAPLTSAAVKGVISGREDSLQQMFVGTAKRMLQAAVVQQAHQFLPDEYATLAVQIADVIKGESFQRILEEQRNVELARVAGTVKNALTDPSDMLSRVKWHANVWWRTLRLARGNEKVCRVATQIALPTLTVLAAGGVFGLALLGSITLLAAAGTALTLVSGGVGIANKTDSVFNTWYSSTRDKVIEEMNAEKRRAAKEKIKGDIQRERDLFIDLLREKHVLPSLKMGAMPELTPEQDTGCKSVKDKQVMELIRKMTEGLKLRKKENAPLSVVDCIQTYQKEIESFKTFIAKSLQETHVFEGMEESKRRHLVALLAHQVQNEVVEKWLTHRIESVLRKKAMTMPLPAIGQEKRSVSDPNAFVEKELALFLPNSEERKTIMGRLFAR